MYLRTKLIIILISIISFGYGIAVGKYKIFPHDYLSSIKNQFTEVEIDSGERNREHLISQYEFFSRKVDVVMIGDSLTAGGRWSDIFPHLSIANRGVSADKGSDILLRIDSIVSTKPKIAFLSFGINDLKEGVPINRILNDYELIIAHLLDHDINVVAQSTIQCSCGRVNQINILNEGLRELANKKKITYLDLGELALKTGLEEEFTYDGIHLTGKAYKHWFEKMLPIVSSYDF